MAKSKKAVNPFYILLVVIGTAFALTACAYGVMAVVKIDPATADQSAEHGLIHFMDQHGVTVMMVELGLLAVATFAAIATDEYWSRRTANEKADETKNDGDTT